MWKRARAVVAVLVVAAVVAAAAVTWRYQAFVETPLIVGEAGMVFTVPKGATVESVAWMLAERGTLEAPRYLKWMARLTGKARRIQAGEYRIPPGTTPPELLAKLTSGEVVQHALTVVEGWTFHELMDAVRSHEALVHTLKDVTPQAVMARLGKPDEHPEGRFHPETYHFPRGTTDVEFLERAYDAMAQRLAREWEAREEGLPLETPYQALILASIVERETGLPEERPRIAGVFIRRLDRGMRLQTDPTVIYGLGADFDGDIRYRDLRRDSPYNTYRRSGLPPTPIAMPSGESIRAVLHPADEDALYFVSRGDGSHHFSATLEEHNRAVRRYQLGRN
ncbi:MAG: endolytic transglycosylase MltG [Gammaproteobacteria bacterium]|nr:endolytic transglycosylase MltG [Gammaproteobacteria bacterium]NIV75177.1 endolytic transglycosylase MltG [Gammaproteobacteria bacterium]